MYYSNPAIQTEIRRRAKKGLVIFSTHGGQRAGERDVDDEEIFKCLQFGVLEGEDWDPSLQEATYRVVRKHSRETTLVVVVGLTDLHDIVVTTFFRGF